jgi:hypothetical protein
MRSKYRVNRFGICVGVGAAILAIGTGAVLALSPDAAGFPEGYDAVQAAPNSHKVIFENTLVRVLEVTVPAAGETEPMHHHRWPSFFLGWDTGGKSPHIRYHTPDGIRDSPSKDAPVHKGHWSVHWMKPEPLHAIETVEKYSTGEDPPLIRVEIKIPQP